MPLEGATVVPSHTANHRCGAILGRERIGKEEWHAVHCLLPRGHDGPHADWTAWIGIVNPDFSKPGASRDDDATRGFLPGIIG